MKLTAEPASKTGKTRILTETTLNLPSNIQSLEGFNEALYERRIFPAKDGGVFIRFYASGIDNENATYLYKMALSKDEVDEIVASHKMNSLINLLSEQNSKIDDLERQLNPNRWDEALEE